MLPARKHPALAVRGGRAAIGLLCAGVLALGLAACQAPEVAGESGPAARGYGDPRTEADTRSAAIASGEPGKDRQQWRAANDAARQVTGNLTASLPDGSGGPLMLAFANGVTLRLSVLGLRTGADETGGLGGTFAKSLGAAGDASVYVYKVVNEVVDSTAPKGGLCIGGAATHVAAAEYVDENGDWRLNLAAFRGVAAPGPEAQADPELCAAYAFGLG